MPSLHTVMDTLQLAVGDMVKGSEELMKYVRYRQQDIEISEIFSRMFEKLKADLASEIHGFRVLCPTVGQ